VVNIYASNVTFTGFEVDGNQQIAGGIYVGYHAPASITTVTVNNCVVHDNGGPEQTPTAYYYGIHVGSVMNTTTSVSNVTLTNNTVYNTGHEGIAIYPTWLYPNNTVSTVLVRNNTIYNTAHWGGQSWGDGVAITNSVANATIEFNTIYNAFRGLNIGTSASYTGSPTGLVVRYNIIHDNTVAGINLFPASGMTSDGVFYDNLIFNNGKVWDSNYAADILINGGYNYNTSVFSFYNNTIYNVTNATAIPHSIWISPYQTITGTPTFNFKNNIVYTKGFAPVWDGNNYLTHVNNLLYRSDSTTAEWVNNGTSYPQSGVATWEATAQSTNPLFLGGTLPSGFTGTYGTNEVPNTSFFLTGTSLVLDKGATLGGVYTGCINGAGLTTPITRPQGAAYDIGAYEMPPNYYLRSDGNDNCNGKYDAAGSSGNCAWTTQASVRNNYATIPTGAFINIRNGDTLDDGTYIAPHNQNLTIQGYNSPSQPSTVPPIIKGTTAFTIRASDTGGTCLWKGLWLQPKATGNGVYLDQSGQTLAYDIISGAPATGIQIRATGILLTNDLLYNNAINSILMNTSATGTLENSQIIGSLYPINTGSGTLSHGNNIYYGNSYSTSAIATPCSGCTDLGNNQLSVNPKILQNPFPTSPISVHVDQNSTFFLSLVNDATISGRGAKITFSPMNALVLDAYYGVGGTYANTKAPVTAAVAAGNEVAVHGNTYTTLNVDGMYYVTTSNTGINTITIDGVTTKTFSLASSGNPGNNYTKSWVANNDLQMATTDVTAMAAKGWVLTPIGSFSDGIQWSSLKDMAAVTVPASGTACMIQTDRGTASNRFFHNEIDEAATTVDSYFGITTSAFTFPHGSTYTTSTGDTDGTVSTYMAAYKPGGNLKITGARNTTLLAGGGALVNDILNSQDIYHFLGSGSFYLCPGGTCAGATEAHFRAAAREVYGWTIMGGGVFTIYMHGLASDPTEQQIAWFIDEFYKAGGTVSTFSNQIAGIKANHTSADDGITWTPNTPYTTANFRPSSTSPGINTGVSVCTSIANLSDSDGNPVCSSNLFVGNGTAPTIGLYQYQGTNSPSSSTKGGSGFFNYGFYNFFNF
jgi:hypothetical protein